MVALLQSNPTELEQEPSWTMASTAGWEVWTAAGRPTWIQERDSNLREGFIKNLTFVAASSLCEGAKIVGASSIFSPASYQRSNRSNQITIRMLFKTHQSLCLRPRLAAFQSHPHSAGAVVDDDSHGEGGGLDRGNRPQSIDATSNIPPQSLARASSSKTQQYLKNF
jgi:hypothetical protein